MKLHNNGRQLRWGIGGVMLFMLLRSNVASGQTSEDDKPVEGLQAQLAKLEAEDKKRADELFANAVKLRKENNIVAACPLIEQAHKLDPTEGSFFALADCWDQAGRQATALRLYETYLLIYRNSSSDTNEKRARRIEVCKERIPRLQADTPKLKLVWPGKVPPDVVVRIDDRVISEPFNVDLPLDLGDHWVDVVQISRRKHPFGVRVRQARPTVEVNLEQVDWLPVPEAPPKVEPPVAIATASPDSSSDRRWIITNASIAGGLLAVGFGAAIGTNIAAPGVIESETMSDDEYNRRKSLQVGLTYASIASFIGAAVVGGTTAVVVLTGAKRSDEAKRTTLRVMPTLGGVVLRGNF